MLKTIEENPMKNDFVLTSKKYLEILKLNLPLKEIEKMSKFKLRGILRGKIKNEALVYLNNQKIKQDKIKRIIYNELKMQNYLADGDRNTSISKVIYKARGKILDIKTQKSWKYDDNICVGCQINIESGEEVLNCEKFGKNENEVEYSWFYSVF